MLLDCEQVSELLGDAEPMTTQRIVIERGCLAEAGAHMQALGLSGSFAAIYDANTYAAAGKAKPAADQEIILNPEGLHADEKAVAEALSRLNPDIKTIIAVGSGTVHDISRYCAYERGADLVSCPTAASVDGFCSNVAAMTWHGSKKTLPAVAPKLVAADLDIISQAPLRLARSGIGDILGKYIALSDWKIARILTGERYDETIAATMAKAVDIVKASVQDIIGGSAEAYEKLMYGLVLSGLAMQAFGNSRPASGAEHHVSHLIEMHPQPLGVSSAALHGEKVGVGTLIMSERYHEFRKKDPAHLDFQYALPGKEALEASFGDLASAIADENKNDCLALLDPAILWAHWDEIGRIIETIPSAEELLPLYEQAGMVKSLPDIGVAEEKKEALISLSPLVRNRLTLARIMRCIKEK